jgi:hypothetical protein
VLLVVNASESGSERRYGGSMMSDGYGYGYGHVCRG